LHKIDVSKLAQKPGVARMQSEQFAAQFYGFVQPSRLLESNGTVKRLVHIFRGLDGRHEKISVKGLKILAGHAR
jgi:hypothetical protein